MSKVQKIRYGSFNLVVAPDGEKFSGHAERAVTRERLGGVVVGSTFDEAVMAAKLEALRLADTAAQGPTE